MATTIVFAEDSYLVREGTRRLLEEAGYELLAVAGSYEGLLDAVGETPPDVVITDIRMPPTRTDEGIRAAREIRRDHPGVGVVVLSQYVEPDYALALFEDGSEGLAYLLKERLGDLTRLEEAIAEVRQGGSVIDPKVVDALVEGRLRREQSRLDRLTPRETEVLGELAAGRTNAAIAERLGVSDRAVEKHVNAIFTKLELAPEPASNRRVRAVVLYLAEVGS